MSLYWEVLWNTVQTLQDGPEIMWIQTESNKTNKNTGWEKKHLLKFAEIFSKGIFFMKSMPFWAGVLQCILHMGVSASD